METVHRAAAIALASYQERFPGYQPVVVWTGPEHGEISFHIKGMTIHAIVDLRPRAIQVSMEVPLIFRMFRERAIWRVEAEIKKWLLKAREEPG